MRIWDPWRCCSARFGYAGLDRLRHYDIELSVILHSWVGDIHGLKTSCSVISKVKRTEAEQQWELEVILSQNGKEVVLVVCHTSWVTKLTTKLGLRLSHSIHSQYSALERALDR